MSSVFANNKNKQLLENLYDTNEEDEEYNVDRFLIPFAIKNKEHMVNAIQINVNDTNDKFTPDYKPSIEKVLSYIEEYCTILQQNGKQCLNQQQIKHKVETFFEDEENWNVANSNRRDVILEKILSAKQFQEFKDPKIIIDFEAVDGGSKRKGRKTARNRRKERKGRKTSRKSRQTRRKTARY